MATIGLLGHGALRQTASRDILTHFKRAVTHLALSDGRLKDRLLFTLQHLDAALAECDGWPAGLYDRAHRVAAELDESREWIRRGGGSTVTRLAESLGQQILELAIDLEVPLRIESKLKPSPVDTPAAEDVTPALISSCPQCITATESVPC